MPEDDRKILLEILQSVARLETEVKSIKVISDTANEARDIAKEALQSTKSAHHRLDEIDKELEFLKTENSNKWEKIWEKAFWTIVGAAISYFIYKGSGH